MFVIQSLSDLLSQDLIQSADVDHHGRVFRYRTADRNKAPVRMPVTVLVGTGAKFLLVALRRPHGVVIAVCRAELDGSRQVCFGHHNKSSLWLIELHGRGFY